MSNLEVAPVETLCRSETERKPDSGRVLDARLVPLGGPRAMTVRRTLPQRERSLIGAWCFVDHFGPDDVSGTGGMAVAGHPHTGLQTVSWLFSGAVEHRDTVGTHAIVRPGELSLMTAGIGIAHSEYSTPSTTVLHGVQLWLALPQRHRHTEPSFAHYAPPMLHQDGAEVLVFLGSLFGATSPVGTFSPLLGADLSLRGGQTLVVPTNPEFEHGVLVDTGTVVVNGTAAGAGHLVFWPTGAEELILESVGDQQCRVLLLGGAPLGEEIVLWWNFIGRSHEEVATYRAEWQQARLSSGEETRFGPFPDQWNSTLAAPALPNARLKPRE